MENKKEELLERSRKSSNDEGMENAERQGSKLGEFIAVEIIGLPLLIFCFFTGQINTALALLSIASAFSFGQTLKSYRFTKEWPYLVCTIFEAIFAVVFLILFVVRVMGW